MIDWTAGLQAELAHYFVRYGAIKKPYANFSKPEKRTISH